MGKQETTVFDQEYGKMYFQDLEGNMTLSAPITLIVSKEKVDVFFSVKSKVEQPTKMQREFLKNVVFHFDEILDSIFRKLPKEFSGFTRQELARKIQLQTISVPLVDEGQEDWDMSFIVMENKKMTLLIAMRNWETISAVIEIDPRNWFTGFMLKIITKL